MLRHLTLAAVLTCLPPSGAARAGFLFEFADDATQTPNHSFSALPGDSLTIDVFLAEAAGETQLETVGLATAGVRVTASGAADAAQLVTALPNASLFDFSALGSVDSPSTGYVAEAAFVNNITGPEILLGRFTFVVPAGANAGGITTLTTGLPNLSINEQDNFLNDSTLIDGMIASDTATITVLGQSSSVVPEPSSLMLASMGLAGWIGGANWRRRRRSANRV